MEKGPHKLHADMARTFKFKAANYAQADHYRAHHKSQDEVELLLSMKDGQLHIVGTITEASANGEFTIKIRTLSVST